jgi:periplasmic protein TonB
MVPPPRGYRDEDRKHGFLASEGGTMFEHSLIDMERRPRPRRWLSLPIAVALHIVALGTFAFASYWNVSEVPAPDLIEVYFSEPAIPVALLGGGPRLRPVEPEPQPEPEPVRPDEPVQPTLEDVPEDVPTPAPVPNTATTDSEYADPNAPAGPGVPWGRPDGEEDVVTPGGGGNINGPGTVEAPEEGPVHITVGITRPEILHKVNPRYTEPARRAGVQGTVIIEAIIDEKGRVTDQRILRSLPMGLDKAAMDAVQQWRFSPAMRGDSPVKVYFVLTVNFTIQR